MDETIARHMGEKIGDPEDWVKITLCCGRQISIGYVGGSRVQVEAIKEIRTSRAVLCAFMHAFMYV